MTGVLALHESFSSHSGSVEKSQAIRIPL